MSSMIELIKEISTKGHNEKCMMTQNEYDELMKELHSIDPFLQKKYLSYHSVPRIYSLYGVEVIIHEG